MSNSDQVASTHPSRSQSHRKLSPLLPVGTEIDHFRVIRLIGEGGMGRVYLARDTKLGRKVALKMLHGHRGRKRPYLIRFMMEARTTARFSHPNIVTIFAVGEYGQQPYLALEYLSGETLSERIKRRKPGMQETLRIGEAVASALVEAHRRGILHLDLKPGNIIITKGGRTKVLDFGLAQPVELEEALSTSSVSGRIKSSSGTPMMGTPTYMAPEQWRRQPRQPATDIWAVGVLLYQLVMGKRPFDEYETDLENLRQKVLSDDPIGSLPGAPERLSKLILRCLERAPDTRPSAEEVHKALDAMLDRLGQGKATTQNPFRGLLAFTPRQSGNFFGRDREIAEAVERLQHEPVLAVVGASGTGKSSLVQAGIGPRIAQNRQTCVISMRPGPKPFRTLAVRILARGEEVTGSKSVVDPRIVKQLAAELLHTPSRLSLMLEQIAETDHTQVLLIVDQLEELYTLASPEEAQAFMRAITSVADDPEDPVRVIFTVRDDFLSRVATAGPDVRSVLRRMMLVQVPEQAALTEILTKPLAAMGYRYEDPTTVTNMVAAVDGRAAGLPLLQFTAGLLWERRDQDRRLLTKAAYEGLGGVAGALARHADGVLDTLQESEVRIARQVLLRMVTPERTRRVVAREAVLEGLDEPATSVLTRLVEARLVSQVRVSTDDASQPALELAHESLIHSWQRLKDWIDDAKGELRFLTEIQQSAELWDKRGRRADEAWTGDALAEACRSRSRCTEPIPAVVVRFLDAGLAQERRRRYRQRALVLSSFAILVSLSFVLFLGWQQALRQKRETERQQKEAVRQRQEAFHQKHLAEVRQAVAEREGAAAALARGRWFEARAKLRASLEVADSPSSRALWWRLTKEPVWWRAKVASGPGQVMFSPDSRVLAVGMKHGPIHLYDVQTQNVRVLKSRRTSGFKYMRFSPDGSMLAMGSGEAGLSWWSVKDGRRLHEDPTVRQIRGLGFYDKNRRLAVTLLGGQIYRWRVADGVQESPYLQPGPPLWGRDSRYFGDAVLDSGFQGELRLTDLLTGEVKHTANHGTMIEGVDVDEPSGRWVTAGRDGLVRFWSPEGKKLHAIPAGPDRPRSIAYAPDGRWVAIGGYQGNLQVAEAASGAVARSLRLSEGEVSSVRWSPDGRYLAMTSSDRQVILMDAGVVKTPKARPGHRDNLHDIRFTPDGTRVVTGSRDQSVRVFDAKTGRIERVLDGDDGAVDRVALSPDGAHLAWASETVQLMDFRLQGTPYTLQERGTRLVNSIAFDPTGRWLAAVMAPGAVRVYDVASKNLEWVLKTHPIPRLVHFSPSGDRLAVADRFGNMQIFSTRTRQVIREFRIDSSDIRDFQFDPSGRTIASVANNRALHQWDTRTGKGKLIYQTSVDIRRFRFSNDGTQVLLSGNDGKARRLDLASGRILQTYASARPVDAVAWSPDGRWVATGSHDTTVMVFDAATGRPRWRAPAFFRPQTLVSHDGWVDLGTQTPLRLNANWAVAVQEKAALAVEAPNLRFVCLATYAGKVEVWDRTQDLKVRSMAVEDLQDLRATNERCVVRDGGAVVALPFSSKDRLTLVASGATALFAQENRVVVAQTSTVTAFTLLKPMSAGAGPPASKVLHVADSEVTALHSDEHGLYLGFVRGGLIRITPESEIKTFESEQSFPIIVIATGPPGTLLAGTLDGTVGLWSIDNEQQLYTQRLHGSIQHLAYRSGKAYVASHAGASLVWNLDPFEIDRCALVHDVQQQVAVVWQDGRAEARASGGCAN